MRSICASLLAAALLCLPLAAQQKINPVTQVNWPQATGSGAPSSTCDSTNYGQPYTDTTGNNQYVCSSGGWSEITGGGNTTSTGLTPGVFPVANGANSVVNGPLAETASELYFTGNVFSLAEGTAPAGTAGYDLMWADSTKHLLGYNPNGSGTGYLTYGSGSATPGDCVVWGSNGAILTDFGSPCNSGGGGGSPGGSNGELQYNHLGAFGGDTATTDGAGNWTVGSLTTNGTGVASQINLKPSGTSPATVSGSASLGVPNTVTTPGVYLLPAAPGSGLWLASNASGVVTDTLLAEVDGNCALGSGGVWTTGSCGGGVANTTVTVSSGSQGGNSCSSATTLSMTGLTTSMIALAGYTSDISSLTGWGGSGGMVFIPWPSASNTLSWEVCNQTPTTISYSGITFNVGAK